jgi:formylglycine-generating enzyme required for sulfatase activity
MVAKVFISYRRDDSAGHAGRVHDRLLHEFGPDLLFMDVDSIQLGADFVNVLSAEVAKCDVLLAVIGPNWIDARDDAGRRRLESDGDFVRIEIAAALERNIPVVPILLEGTRLPKPEQLPDDLKGLTRRQALDVRHTSFHLDMDKLVRGLRGMSAAPAQKPAPASRSDQMRAEGRIKLDTKLIYGAPDGWFMPGAGMTEWFKDHDHGPEMVIVPSGTFVMGSPATEPERRNGETQVRISITEAFAVGRFAVTFDEWDECVAEGGCNGYKPSDQNWGRGKHPVINVNWDDAKAYASWLSHKTGKSYRLLSEAEREYVTRAGTTTPFWWGSSIIPEQANYDASSDPYKGGGLKGEYRKRIMPVDSFEPNPWGLFCVHGNVWEWTEDCWTNSNTGNPGDGAARTTGDCNQRVVRGGSWSSNPRFIRSAIRHGVSTVDRNGNRGFRLARALTP